MLYIHINFCTLFKFLLRKLLHCNTCEIILHEIDYCMFIRLYACTFTRSLQISDTSSYIIHHTSYIIISNARFQTSAVVGVEQFAMASSFSKRNAKKVASLIALWAVFQRSSGTSRSELIGGR